MIVKAPDFTVARLWGSKRSMTEVATLLRKYFGHVLTRGRTQVHLFYAGRGPSGQMNWKAAHTHFTMFARSGTEAPAEPEPKLTDDPPAPEPETPKATGPVMRVPSGGVRTLPRLRTQSKIAPEESREDVLRVLSEARGGLTADKIAELVPSANGVVESMIADGTLFQVGEVLIQCGAAGVPSATKWGLVVEVGEKPGEFGWSPSGEYWYVLPNGVKSFRSTQERFIALLRDEAKLSSREANRILSTIVRRETELGAQRDREYIRKAKPSSDGALGEAKTKDVTVRKGIAYYHSQELAQRAADRSSAEFPEARLVHYELGWAVQVKRGGDYLGPDDRPADEGLGEARERPEELRKAYKAMQAADDAYSDALTAAYGKEAGDMRYSPSSHKPGSAVARSAAKLDAARREFEAAGGWDLWRNTKAESFGEARLPNAKSVGTRVRTTMGVRRIGTVLANMPSKWTDGTYRDPQSRAEWAEAVPVRWDDGTEGWIHRRFLAEL